MANAVSDMDLNQNHRTAESQPLDRQRHERSAQCQASITEPAQGK